MNEDPGKETKMNAVIHFNKEQVERREYEQLSPVTHDFRWNADFTECDAIPLTWWDDASYEAYQLAGLSD